MAQLPPDLEEQVKHYLAIGQYRTEEDVLRDALRALAEEQATLDDIRQGLQRPRRRSRTPVRRRRR